MKYNNNIVKNVYVYICLFIKLFLLETDYFRRHNPIIFWAHYSLTYLCNHTVRNNIVLMWDLFLIYIYQTLSTKLYRHLKYRFWQLSRNISEYLSWFDRIKYKYISTCFTQWFYYELFFLSLSQMSVLSLYSHTRSWLSWRALWRSPLQVLRHQHPTPTALLNWWMRRWSQLFIGS